MKTFLQALIFSFTLVFSNDLFAQPGTLDSSFGINGNITIPTGPSQAIAIQGDGKIVIAGYVFSNELFVLRKFIIYRFNADGSIDNAFGDSGKVEFLPAGAHDCFVGDLKVQNDGRILLGGTLFEGYGSSFVLVRLNTNGSFDNTFGSGGIAITDIVANDEDILYHLNFKENGSILATGSANGSAEMACYTANGILDTTFGNAGIIYRATEREISSAKTFADGKFLTTQVAPFPGGLIVSKFLMNGNIDSTFGNDGATHVTFTGEGDYPAAMTIDNIGSPVIGGNAFDGENYYPAVLKLKGNGTPDLSFGSAGKVALSFAKDLRVTSISSQWDSKLVLVLSRIYGGNEMIVRLSKEGILDTTFGLQGIIPINLVTLNGLLNHNLNCIAIQKDNKIVITGGNGFNTFRYKNDIPLSISLAKNLSVNEGNIGTTPVQFKVALDRPATTDVFVNYTTKDITATAGTDYVATTGTVRIKAGRTKTSIVVNLIGDAVRESPERFALVLSNPVNAVSGTDSVICTIKNDDAAITAANIVGSNLKSINHSTIKVYPNPVQDIVVINGLEGVSTITITDVNGNVLLQATNSSALYKQNIKHLKSGTYFIKVMSIDKITIHKIIKL